MIVYFSGTGNSRYAAALLADRLGDDLVDAGKAIKAGSSADLCSQTPWVFVAPTYAWQMPRVFEEYIRRCRFSGSREAYFVMTCGQDIGRPEEALTRLCQEKDFFFRGVLEVVMPENYLAMFPVPGPAEAAEIIENAHPVLEAGAENIRQMQPFPDRPTGALDRLKSGPVNRAFYPMFVKSGPFRAGADCDGCGLCEKLCPMNAITMEEEHPRWGEGCTHCMACICNCPKETIEYGRRSKGRPRYRCPDYKG
ncbi:MAG: 4Fe-4S binding protein [Ruminiclostridium sp.]|nr:4Fe-4S binding protein [Ruminiclostridium sp.]